MFQILSFFPILLFFHCIFIFNFKKWLGPLGTYYASLTVLFFISLFIFNEILSILINGNYYFIDFGKWFFCLDLIDSHLIFCFDLLSLLAALLVAILTSLALSFGVEYMYREAFINRLLYLLNLFATSVIFFFFCYDFFLIIFAWECIGLFSFLLVNFYSMRIYTVKAALKTFVFSRISDMFMFLSFVFVIVFFNTTDLSLIFLQIPFLAFNYLFFGSTAVHFLSLFAFCLSTSGVIKAAQFFSHVWLPDAMEAPTPASALIHSSTLVVAGVFLIIRFAVLFEFTILVNFYLAILGSVTLAFGSVTAIFQNDIKKLVAYSTISQIGYLVCGCGFCCYEEVFLYLIIHALNKAFLFILVGYLVHFFNGNTDMRQMGGVYLYSFDIAVLMFGVSLNLAGLPYTAGFINKEFLLFQILKDDFLSLLVRSCWLVSFFFTPIYMLILIFVVIFGPKKGTLTTYKSNWSHDFFNNLKLFINLTLNNNFKKYINKNNFYRFQFTLITGRLTSFILIFFWIFFFSFGESFLMILLNYSTVSDSIHSSFFLNIKNFTIFNIKILSLYTTNVVMFYIFFFSTLAFLFLLNLKYTFFYNFSFFTYFFDFLFMFLTITYLFFKLNIILLLILLTVFIFKNISLNIMKRI